MLKDNKLTELGLDIVLSVVSVAILNFALSRYVEFMFELAIRFGG